MAGSTGQDDRLRDLVSARWPRLDRPASQALILRCLADERIGAIVFGEPGTGKTQLARAAVAALANERGNAVVHVSGSDRGRDVVLHAFRGTLPSMEGVPVPSLLRWAIGRLREAAGNDRLVLVVDDAHLLDPLSAALVHQLAATGGAFVVVFARTQAELPDAIDRFWADGAERLDLDPLTSDEVSEVLAGALGDEVAQTTVQALTVASGGNPLYLRELCLQGLEEGCLDRRAALWTWKGPMQVGVGLSDLLVERIGVLDDAALEALELLAFSEPLGLGMFEQLVDIRVIDGLEQRQLITVDRAGLREEVRLAHPLYGEVLRGRASERAPAIQGRLADTLDALGGRRALDLLQFVRWRLAAGQTVDADDLVAAAEQAAAVFDHVRAEELARAAVDAGGGAPAGLVLGTVLRSLGRFEDAEQVWASHRPPPRHPLHLPIQVARAQNLFFGLGRTTVAATILCEVRETATSDRARDDIAVEHAMMQLYKGRPGEARSAVEHLLTSDSPELRRSAAVFVGPSLALEGRCGRALEVIEDGLTATAASNDQVTGVLLAARFLALQMAGHLHEAELQARFARDVALGLGAYDGVAIFGLAVGQGALMGGRIDEAVTELEEAAVLLREHDRNRYLPWVLGELAQARVLRGDVDAAQAALAEADAVRHPAFRLFECRLETARARVTAAAGHPDDAVEQALAAGASGARDGYTVLAAHAYHDVVRLGAPGAAAGALARLARRTDSELVATLSDHATATRDGDTVALERSADRFEQIGAMLLAAEAHRDASVQHAANGRTGTALASATQARRVGARCVGAELDWLADLPGANVLSPREQEVAELTAAGLSSRDVAERLYVSVRTVENHLHRTYTKLGLSGRSELAAALSPDRAPAEWPVAHDTSTPAPYVASGAGSQEVKWTRSP